MRTLIFSILFISILSVSAQSSQGEYLEAKRQFGLGNYTEAKQAFQNITNDGTFGAYASFYYALSSLKLNQSKEAEDMFKQIKVKFPDWEQQQEVDYWLAYLAFDQNNLWQAFRRVENLPENWRNFLVDNFLEKLSVSGLDSAYALNPNNSYIGTYYAKAIQNQPYDERDQLLLLELAEKFNLTIGPDESLPIVKKDEYAIAVVLPFMYEGLATPKTVIRNSIIFDLYQGMNKAQEDLKEQGISVNLFPYDTKKKGSVANDLVKDGKLDKADAIVGPLYTGPSRYISQFSKENKVTMINPVSSNEEIIGDNPYSFLFKPAYSTQGREAARFAAQKFTDNKKLFIFYETDRDSIIANAYRETIERDSFFVVRFERLTNEDAQQIQIDFTEQYEVRLDTMYSQDEIDSIALIPGRTVRTRSLRNEESGRIMRDSKGEDVIESYEVKFTVQPDSIGHIFAATSSNLLANNFISMVEVRSDSIGIIGYQDWLNFSLVSYAQLERLQIDFLSPSYYDLESENYDRIKRTFVESVGIEPSEYHIYGYELIWHLGKLMDEHGKYFQRGLLDGNRYSGYIMEGVKYGPYKDNQLVPITTLENLQLRNQNSKQEVNATNEDSNK
ncbi:ABC transporter substrate-binding protein [Ekhidna sp. To15]|uniref:ABC transporter substrate-binding protein n=1 Tax=Ekhidna sp. To15 TaxID=3395267 RepID=UPI003F5242ED